MYSDTIHIMKSLIKDLYSNLWFTKGFTIAELMVSIAIVMVIGTVIIMNQNDFNRSVKLQNITHEIATLIRDTQSRAVNSEVAGYPDYGLGVHFNEVNSSLNNQIYIFANRPEDISVQRSSYTYDGVYDEGVDPDDDPAPLEIMTMPTEFEITQLCTREASTNICTNNHSRSVAFARPNLTPKFGRVNSTVTADWLSIRVSSRNEPGESLYVIVNASGLIYTDNELPS